MTRQQFIDMERESINAISVPTGTLKVTIRASIFNNEKMANYFQNTYWSDRCQTLLKYAIIDTYGGEDYKDEPESYKGNVEAFTSICVIKDRVYTHTYTLEMFEEDLAVAKCMNFKNRAIRNIYLVPAEVITFNENVNSN